MGNSLPSSEEPKKTNRYNELILTIFRNHYQKGATEFEFVRDELEHAAKTANIKLPKNLGDVIYSLRFRTAMPMEIAKTAPDGREWVIKGAGPGKYRMKLQKMSRFVPNEALHQIKIPDATPEIVTANALTDEQAVLAKVRYNRLIDIFLGVTAYSLQNHLRTTVPNIGQIETDEVYVAVRSTGQQFVIPVQAKGGKDKLGVVQVEQDLALCRHKYALLTPRPVAVQSMTTDAGEVIVMFELIEEDDEIKLLDEKHYRLVLASEITPDDLKRAASLK
jgi:hypothetical protein